MEKNTNSTEKEITLSQAAKARILEIKSKPQNQGKHLRISVSGGGCSGFQYKFELDDQVNDDDLKFVDENIVLVTIDPTSLDFLNHCHVDYVNEMGGAYFKIDNPNATANCGCGSSFSI
ncbi:MAG: iron-sulfur cluster insertion protein ErpA [Proteobacteria bacterium]|nr:iron-sulfur cluster insertion protein ErpA [Pseudomonadota bacterium]